MGFITNFSPKTHGGSTIFLVHEFSIRMDWRVANPRLVITVLGSLGDETS